MNAERRVCYSIFFTKTVAYYYYHVLHDSNIYHCNNIAIGMKNNNFSLTNVYFW